MNKVTKFLWWPGNVDMRQYLVDDDGVIHVKPDFSDLRYAIEQEFDAQMKLFDNLISHG